MLVICPEKTIPNSENSLFCSFCAHRGLDSLPQIIHVVLCVLGKILKTVLQVLGTPASPTSDRSPQTLDFLLARGSGGTNVLLESADNNRISLPTGKSPTFGLQSSSSYQSDRSASRKLRTGSEASLPVAGKQKTDMIKTIENLFESTIALLSMLEVSDLVAFLVAAITRFVSLRTFLSSLVNSLRLSAFHSRQ